VKELVGPPAGPVGELVVESCDAPASEAFFCGVPPPIIATAAPTPTTATAASEETMMVLRRFAELSCWASPPCVPVPLPARGARRRRGSWSGAP
jgi:hypothetical protein